jgi:hypothetical protein
MGIMETVSIIPQQIGGKQDMYMCVFYSILIPIAEHLFCDALAL